MAKHRTREELQAGLDEILRSPRDGGRLEAIVIRPKKGERESLTECELSLERGVHGDHWADGCWMTLPDGSPNPDVQVAMINSRVIDLVAGERERWPLAGDNLYVDLDLSTDNLAEGQRLNIGSVILEITGVTHSGCSAFSERYGKEALRFFNSAEGSRLRLRGIYARVVERGTVRAGDEIRKC